MLHARPPSQVQDFFAARGISHATLLRNRVAQETVEGEPVIAFPYFREGMLVNIKYRTLDKRFWQVKGAAKILYGLGEQGTGCVFKWGGLCGPQRRPCWCGCHAELPPCTRADDITGSSEIVIVEGEMDKLALEEAGITNVVSVRGTSRVKASASVASRVR